MANRKNEQQQNNDRDISTGSDMGSERGGDMNRSQGSDMGDINSERGAGRMDNR